MQVSYPDVETGAYGYGDNEVERIVFQASHGYLYFLPLLSSGEKTEPNRYRLFGLC